MPGQERSKCMVAIGVRLRYIRQHHPDGPITFDRLARMSGVSERHLKDAESGKANPTVETLEKITEALGINRVAYLLDDIVFDQVNSELRSLQEVRDQGVRGIRLRSSGSTQPPKADDREEAVAALLARLTEIGEEAKRMRRTLPPDAPSS